METQRKYKRKRKKEGDTVGWKQGMFRWADRDRQIDREGKGSQGSPCCPPPPYPP